VPRQLAVSPPEWHHITIARIPYRGVFRKSGECLNAESGVIGNVSATAYSLRIDLAIDLKRLASSFGLTAPTTSYATIAYAIDEIVAESAFAALINWGKNSAFELLSIEHRRSGGGRPAWQFDIIERWELSR